MTALALGITATWAEAEESIPPAEPPAIFEPVQGADAEFLGDSLRESEAATDENTGASSATEPVELVRDARPERHGQWQVRPHLDVRFSYDDNIFIRNHDRTGDFIVAAAPGLSAGFWEKETDKAKYLERQDLASTVETGESNFFLFEYTAIFLGFARTHSQDTVDQDALLRGAWHGPKLTVAGNVHLESKSETNTEVGGRIRRKTISGELTAAYQLSEKTYVGLGVYHRTNDPQDFVETIQTHAEAFFDYAPTEVVRFGLGVASGKVNVQGGADQVFERLLARASYTFTEKLEMELRGGVEFRQCSGDVGDQTNPVFEVRTVWTPMHGTRISLEAFRRVDPSIERPEENLTYTGAALTLERQLYRGWSGALRGGYEFTDYSGRVANGGRNDNYWFVRPSLVYNFAEWGNVELAYEHRRNDSSQAESTFTDNQVSVQLSLNY